MLWSCQRIKKLKKELEALDHLRREATQVSGYRIGEYWIIGLLNLLLIHEDVTFAM